MVAALNSLKIKSYRRHRPEQNLLCRTIETYWPIFVNEQRKVGKTLPHFISDEFDDFLECGIPENGFVRTYCYACRYSGIVPFSCKRRGFCPSCCARRMNDEAAHLVDAVIPEVPTRQWVLSFPFKMRLLIARNQSLMNKALKIYINEIQSFQRKRAKAAGFKEPRSGAVTFIQRFGSALNLNIHFHTVIPDGVFYKTSDGYRFHRLAEPSFVELCSVAIKIRKKVLNAIEKMGLIEDFQTFFDEESLGEMQSISITQKAAFGDRAGTGLKRFGVKKIEVDPEGQDPYSAKIDGFSLNASVSVPAQDRKRLEQLIRYMARGPIATERLSEGFPNQLVYKMKSPWRDGTTHVSFSHLDFIARLVALIPPPRMKMVRYHGCFAPNFKDRDLIVKRPSQKKGTNESYLVNNFAKVEKVKKERLRWAEMLKRTFKIDVTVCPRCSGRLEQIAVIKDKAAAKKILESLGELSSFRPLEVIESRGPPCSDDFFIDEIDQRDPTW